MCIHIVGCIESVVSLQYSLFILWYFVAIFVVIRIHDVYTNVFGLVEKRQAMFLIRQFTYDSEVYKYIHIQKDQIVIENMFWHQHTLDEKMRFRHTFVLWLLIV